MAVLSILDYKELRLIGQYTPRNHNSSPTLYSLQEREILVRKKRFMAHFVDEL